MTFTVDTDNGGNVVSVKVKGTADATIKFIICDNLPLTVGTTYVMNGCPSGGGENSYTLRIYPSTGSAVASDTGTGASFEYQSGYYVSITVVSGTTISTEITYKPMIRLSSVSDATFAPYANECPIFGHTECNIIDSVPAPDENDQYTFEPIQSGSGDPSPTDPRLITPGLSFTRDDSSTLIAYGGSLTVNEDRSGTLVVDTVRVKLSTFTWTYNSLTTYFRTTDLRDTEYFNAVAPVCEIYASAASITSSSPDLKIGWAGNRIAVKDARYTNATLWETAVGDYYVVVHLKPENQATYNLTNSEVSRALAALGIDRTTIPINWQSEAGTIYGGTITLNEDKSADILKTYEIVKVKDLSWSYFSIGNYFRTTEASVNLFSNNIIPISDSYISISSMSSSSPNNSVGWGVNSNRIVIKDIRYTDASIFKKEMGEVSIVLAFKTENQIKYHITNIG